jgi:DNA-binding winged helix-turn-helix (wHTH) protein
MVGVMTRYQFEGYSLDLQSYELRHQGQHIKIRRKVFNMLGYLIAQHDRVVSKAEFLEHLKPGQFVAETTLTSCIMEMRQALGDRGRGHRIIQTLHGRGYRFVASLEIQSDDVADSGAQPAPPSSPDQAGLENFTGSPVTSVSSPALSAVSLPPLSALHQSAPGTGVSEYKPVTVLVGLLVDTTERLQALAPEALHSLRQVFFTVVLETVQEYGGTVQQMHEGLFRALFGAPIVHEDHARRAVLAAVALRQRLHECHTSSVLPAGAGLAVRLGVHTGQVVVGPLGEAPHLTITAVGDTLEVADQLQRLALPGMILLSEATRQLVQGEV